MVQCTVCVCVFGCTFSERTVVAVVPPMRVLRTRGILQDSGEKEKRGAYRLLMSRLG